MHSMLRQNQVRQQDVKPYIRTFTRNNPMDLNEWAKEEGGLFEPGTLIFLLEPAKRPPGMSSFARGQAPGAGGAADAAQDGYRVKDMCVVVDKIDGKCWVLAISPSAFELRFIDTLFREKTQKAFLEGLDFQYLACAPRPVLNDQQQKELRQLSTLYSKSGSRRTIAQDGVGPEEPARAMLSFLGADLSSVGKQMIELGLICNLIFSPEGVQENKAQSQVKSCFSPILATDKLKKLQQSTPAAPAPTPATESSDEQVSLLSPAYLENEAREAADFLAYNQPEPGAAPASAGVWTSTPAAPSNTAPGADEFKALAPPSFDLGGFPSGGPGGGQPGMMSPDMPAILTGEHAVISVDQKLNTDDANGSKVPALPAWYMTTHNINEMNEVALRRAAESPTEMPAGLDKLESELSYDALPVVDARFRPGAEPPTAQPYPGSPDTLVPGAQTQMEQDASGAWAQPPQAAALGQAKDFNDAIFEGTGGRGSLETNPDAVLEQSKKTRGQAGDWQQVDSGSSGSAFVSPGSTARSQPEIPDPSNLFDRLGGAQAPEEAPPAAPSWADGERGRPTNLKDMLTADSAVFTTDSGKLKEITPAPQPENPSLEMPPPAVVETPHVEEPTAATDSTTEAPSPWMNLAKPESDSVPEPSSAWDSPKDPGGQSSSSWDAFNQQNPVEQLDILEAPEAPTSPSDHVNELAAAMRGLMTSPDAIEPGTAVDQTAVGGAAGAGESLPEATGSEDLFGDVMDKVMDLAETAQPVEAESSEAQPSAEVADAEFDMFEDGRDQTMDLDSALLQRLSSGPATLHTTQPEETEEAPAAPPVPPAPTFSTDTSLVSSAMAAHAQAMVEPEEQAQPADELQLSAPEVTATTEPTASEPVASELTASEPEPKPTPAPTPLRPGRRRTAELRAGIKPLELPADALLEPAAAEPEAPAAPVTTEAEAPAEPESASPHLDVPETTIVTPDVTPGEDEPASSLLDAAPLDISRRGSMEQIEAPTPPAEELVEPEAAVDEPSASESTPPAPGSEVSEPAAPEPAIAEAVTTSVHTDSSTSTPALTTSQENELADLGDGFDDEEEDQDTHKPAPYGQESKLTASGVTRTHQPTNDPKLVISESTRFMARLNQRLSEADKKLSSRCEQSRDRLLRELDALVEEAHKVERQNELSTGALTEQLMTHLETVSSEVKARIEKTSQESRKELSELIQMAENTVTKMHTDLKKELDGAESTFQADSDALAEGTRSELNQHAQERINDFNQKLEEISNALESVYKHHINVLMTRFEKFQTRLNEEVDAIISALDRNVGSMTVEIDGSWDRASEKLMASQTEFGNSVNYLVHSCRAELKQVHLESYAKRVLPQLLENKDIFRTMLLDMKRNFEEQSANLRKTQLSSLADSITTSKTELDKLTKECLNTIESVGKGQQFGLEELFNSTNARLEEIISTVETRLKSAKQEITDNDEACMKTSEASRVEDEPAFSREKQAAIAALNECRTKADNALETHISSSCLDLEHLSEEMQEDLAKQRQDWTAQVRTTADENINKVKQAIQDAFQAIDSAKEKHMD